MVHDVELDHVTVTAGLQCSAETPLHSAQASFVNPHACLPCMHALLGLAVTGNIPRVKSLSLASCVDTLPATHTVVTKSGVNIQAYLVQEVHNVGEELLQEHVERKTDANALVLDTQRGTIIRGDATVLNAGNNA
jgi:hypothetical protein